MTDPPSSRTVLIAVGIVALAGAVLAAPAAAGGSAPASAAPPDPDCAGSGGGALYVTDTGLVAFENDSAILYGTFPSGRAVDFGELKLAADGLSQARVESGTGDVTCLGKVRVGNYPIAVRPAGENDVVLDGNFSSFAFRDVVFDDSDGGVDLAYSSGERTTITVESTGLPEGTTVEAVDVDRGALVDSAAVDADGSVTLRLFAGSSRIDLRAARPTFLDVTVDSTNSPVLSGDTLTVTATVENQGSSQLTRDVSLDVGDQVPDRRSVTLAAGESKTLTLSWETGAADVGDYTAVVTAGNDSETTPVTVQSRSGFDVEIVETNEPIVVGENYSLTARVTNVGVEQGTDVVKLEPYGVPVDDRELTLDAGESTLVTLTWQTGPGDVDDYTVRVVSSTDSDYVNATVAPEGSVLVSIDEVTSPVTEGDRLVVTATVENTDDDPQTERIVLTANGTEVNATEVTLDAGETRTIDLAWATAEGDAGTYELVVASDDVDDNATVTVDPADGDTPPDPDGDGDPATDIDGDDLFEDVDGDGDFDVFDVLAFFRDVTGPDSVTEGDERFDFDADGDVDIFDVETLFNQL